MLGPFRLTLSTGAMLLGLVLLYAPLFRMPLGEYLPHLAAGLVVWNAVAGLVNDATASLADVDGVIGKMRLPPPCTRCAASSATRWSPRRTCR